ncbi:MAG: hypothetical protein ACR2OV_09295, partial [Hyphomicrobiaceae bacterium]
VAIEYEFPNVSEVLRSIVNGYRTFLIPPDGSKEGWAESEEEDERRNSFVAWLEAQCYEDGSSPLAWAEVQYGDEQGVSKICRHSGRRTGATGAR